MLSAAAMPSKLDSVDSKPLNALQTWPIALLLALIGGYVDIVGYLSAYQVFTAHMSGNTADVAKHIYALQWSGIARHAWPILMFVGGLTFASIAFEAQKRRAIVARLPTTIVLECLLLLVFVIVTITTGPAIPPQPMTKYYLMVGLLALAMGVQNVTIRRVGGLHVYTTFITGSLVLFAEAASEYIFWFMGQLRQRGGCLAQTLRASRRLPAFEHIVLTAALWLCYLAGATAGVFALNRLQTQCVVVPLIVLIAIAIYGAVRPFIETIAEEW